jgi:hypothetical protein
MNEINETSVVLFNVSPAIYSYSDKKHILRRVEISKCKYFMFKIGRPCLTSRVNYPIFPCQTRRIVRFVEKILKRE